MPDRPSLAAASRTVTGKKVARLRHEGLLPAVALMILPLLLLWGLVKLLPPWPEKAPV